MFTFYYIIILQSKVDVDGDKFVEYHRDKDDPTLDAQMTREIVNGELVVVCSKFYQ